MLPELWLGLCSFKLFSQRKPSVTAEWQEKLPDFVRRLEEALYRTASSKVRTAAGAFQGGALHPLQSSMRAVL